MKIQCDVCERAPATLICCADEAALCAKCDLEVHAENKLASKHQRLPLQSLSNKLPPCDICQEKPAFIFCVEDRALFCQDCDEPVHPAGSLAANHRRFLATGIRVALNSKAHTEGEKLRLEPSPPSKNEQQSAKKIPTQKSPGISSPSWAVDDLLHISDFDSSDRKEELEFGELEWFSDMGLFEEQIAQKTSAAAEVPQLPVYQWSNATAYRPTYYYMPYKKPKLETPDDDDDQHFTVPDLG